MNIFYNHAEGRPRAGWRIFLQYLLMILCIGLAMGLLQNTGESDFFSNILPQGVGAIFSVWAASRYLDKRPFRDLGLNFSPVWASDLGVGLLISTIGMSLIFITEWLMGWLSVTAYATTDAKSSSFGWSIVLYFGIMILVAFYEELLFRGYLIKNLFEGCSFQRWPARYTASLALLTASIVFGLMHALNPHASVLSTLNIVLAGVMLGLPYLLTGRLGFSIGLHIGWNFLQGAVFGFPVSGVKASASFIQIHQLGTPLWTGGDFGPEAGLTGVLGMIIILALSCMYIKSTHNLKISASFYELPFSLGKLDE